MSLTFKPIQTEIDSISVKLTEEGNLTVAGNLQGSTSNSVVYYTVSDNNGNTSSAPIFIKMKERTVQQGANQSQAAESTVTDGVAQNPPVKPPETRYYTLLPRDLTLVVERGKSKNVDLKNYVEVVGVEKSSVTLLFEPSYKFTENLGKGEIIDKKGIFSYSSVYNGIPTEDFFIYTVNTGKGDKKSGRISIQIIDGYSNAPPKDTDESDIDKPSGWDTSTSGGSSGGATNDSAGSFVLLPSPPPAAPNLSLTPWAVKDKEISGGETSSGAFKPNEVSPPSITLLDDTRWGINENWQDQQSLMQDSTPVNNFIDSTRPYEEDIIEGVENESTQLILCNLVSTTDTRIFDILGYNYRFLCISDKNKAGIEEDGIVSDYYPIAKNFSKFFNLDEHEKQYPNTLIITLYRKTYGVIIPSTFKTPFKIKANKQNSCNYKRSVWLIGDGYNKLITRMNNFVNVKDYTVKCEFNDKEPIDIKSNIIDIISYVNDNTVAGEPNRNFEKPSEEEINFMKYTLSWDNIRSVTDGYSINN